MAIFAPKEKAEELGAHITNLSERMEVQIMIVYDYVICKCTRVQNITKVIWNQVLTKIDAFLADLLEFNKAIVQFDSVLTGLDSWINGKGQV